MSTQHYDDALDRLIGNKPIILLKGKFSINNDSVAIEAGRRRGSIKASRYPDLIRKINHAEKLRRNKQKHSTNKSLSSITKLKLKYELLDRKYQVALNREVMYQLQIEELKKELTKFHSQVVNLHP